MLPNGICGVREGDGHDVATSNTESLLAKRCVIVLRLHSNGKVYLCATPWSRRYARIAQKCRKIGLRCGDVKFLYCPFAKGAVRADELFSKQAISA